MALLFNPIVEDILNERNSVMATKTVSKASKSAKASKGKKAAKAATKPIEAPQQRNYALATAEIKEVKSAKTLADAYNKGSYHFSIAALEAMGKNKWHSLTDFKQALCKGMGKDCWAAFESKKPRNENGLDLNGRILQNLLVLQRVKDYGLKLLQVGAVIDLRRNDAGKGEVRLNTKSTEPMKLGRKAKAAK